MANKQPKKQPAKRGPQKRRGRPPAKKTVRKAPQNKCENCDCMFRKIKQFFCKLFKR